MRTELRLPENDLHRAGANVTIASALFSAGDQCKNPEEQRVATEFSVTLRLLKRKLLEPAERQRSSSLKHQWRPGTVGKAESCGIEGATRSDESLGTVLLLTRLKRCLQANRFGRI